MCSGHSGRHTVIVILPNPLLAISTDESAVIKAPYVHPRPPTAPYQIKLFMLLFQQIYQN